MPWMFNCMQSDAIKYTLISYTSKKYTRFCIAKTIREKVTCYKEVLDELSRAQEI